MTHEKQEALWERILPPHLIWVMWNRLARCETVYPTMFQNVLCSMLDLSWKFHENLFMYLSVILMTYIHTYIQTYKPTDIQTDRQTNQQRWIYNLHHSAEVIKFYINTWYLTLLMLQVEYSDLFGQYNACWCPGSLRHKGISRPGLHSIG